MTQQQLREALALKRILLGAAWLFGFLFVALWLGRSTLSAAPLPNPANATIITVDTTLDPDPGSLSKACNDPDGPGGVYQGASPCSFRRAIIEASARPQADRPIIIRFKIPPTDANYDPTLETWTIQIDDTLPPLETPSITNLNGQVFIDGSHTLDPSGDLGGRTDAPRIIIDTNDYSFEVESENNVIQNLAWKGGGVIFLKEDNNTVENIWMGLTDDGLSVAFREPGNEFRLAGGGIHATSNGNVISGTVVVGAFSRAIDIQGDNNVVQNNYVGTRADGTVPAVSEQTKCQRSLTYDPANWYGGWGIQVTGTGNEIVDNVIAGLHQLQSANDTPPMALEVDGADHLIQNNKIGVDGAGSEVGVCGIGILISGSGTEILDNQFVQTRKGFEEDTSDTTIYVSSSAFSGGQITMRRNIIKDGPTDAINFSQFVDQEWKLFEPAEITDIDGTAVTGTSGDGNTCAGCLVDVYLDDKDGRQEALEYLGTATAGGNGDFTFTLAAPLGEDEGLRTISTIQSFGVVGSLGTGTSSKMSALYTLPVAPTAVTISGPTEGEAATEYAISITVDPADTTLPITYTIETTDQSPIVTALDSTAADLTITWTSDGTKQIDVTVDNGYGTAGNSHTIVIGEDTAPTPTPSPTPSPSPTPPPEDGDYAVYLPLIRR